MAARNATDPDVWWHLRTGQLILQNHAVFRVDPFSFTRFGKPWINHEWLSGILMYALYRLCGWVGLLVVFAAITSATLVLAFLRCPARPAVSAIITVCGAIASAPSWGVRPQIFSLLFISIFVFALDVFNADPFGKPISILWLPFLTLLWVNLHGGYAAGLALIALYILGALLDASFGAAPWSQTLPNIRKMFLVLMACVAMVPLNPYGMKMFAYPFATLHSQAIQGSIQEWASPNFHESKSLALLFMVVATTLLLALSPRRLRPRQVLFLLAATAAALVSVRHIPIYALIAVPLLSQLAEGYFEQRSARNPPQSRPVLRASGKLLLNASLVLALAAFAIGRVFYLSQQQAEKEAHEFPRAAVNFLFQHHLPEPILNDYAWGGYLIWNLYPYYPVFIDGRTDLYGDTVMPEFIAGYYLNGDWAAPLEKWGIRTALLPPDAPLAVALRLRPGWRQVYSDAQSVVLTCGR